MRHTRIFCFIILSSFLSSCLLIQESRNKKNLADIEYERVYEEDDEYVSFDNNSQNEKDEYIETEQAVSPKINIKSNEVWYHPNPWWRIKTEPFPESPSPILYKRYAPQYGFPKYVDPITNSLETDQWAVWVTQNHWDYNEGLIIHMWQAFIKASQNILEQHPEYLAEKDGVRLGYGKTNKLCVSNKKLQNLFTEYVINRIKINPHHKFISVEPSDGLGFCTCKECSKLGNISNQVFYFANTIGKSIKKDYPQKQIGLYAYYQHSEVPDFKLEDNIKVVLVPQGFQTIYTSLGMMEAWKKHHQNLGLYDYFGIPQWTADLPRINVEYFVSNINFANKNNIDFLNYESATNINAIIVSTLLSKMAMNPNLSWNDVFEKFLNDCFKNAKKPIRRLFNRWHTYGVLDPNEINFSLYDLSEASELAKDKEEIQRVRDLKAYLLYVILYKEWNTNREDLANTKKYFDYVYNSSNRNIVNIRAITTVFNKHFNKIPELNEKYKYIGAQHKPWIKYISDKEIDQLFNTNLKKYPPIKIDYITTKEIEDVISKQHPDVFIDTINLSILNISSIYIYSKSNKIALTPTFNSGTSSLVSISGDNFYVQKFLINNEKWEVTLPSNGLYTISQKRVVSLKLGIQGHFTPLIAPIPKALENKYNTYIINQKRELQTTKGDIPITGSAPYYIIGKKDKP